MGGGGEIPCGRIPQEIRRPVEGGGNFLLGGGGGWTTTAR
jgi:hypothetical protein